MRNRWKIASFGETVVYLHIATVLLWVYMLMTGHGKLLAVSIFSIFLHEMGHCMVAMRCGHHPPEIEITPLGTMMRVDDECQMQKSCRFLMLAAGPLVSLLLCLCALWLTKAGVLSLETGRVCFTSNLFFFIGNLMPVLPLDGGRMLALGLSMRFSLTNVKRMMQFLGMVFGLGFIALNIYMTWTNGGWNLSCGFAGCAMIYASAAGTTSAALLEMRMLMDRRIRFEVKGCLPCKWVVLAETTSLRKALTFLEPRAFTMFLLMRQNTEQMYWIGEDTLISAYLQTPAEQCKTIYTKANEIQLN